MVANISPFLAFTGQGREALAFYLDALPGAVLGGEHVYGAGEEGPEGTLKFAVLRIGAGMLRIIDAPAESGFEKTSGVSMFVDCETADEVDALAEALGDGGAMMMPVGEYPFADRFCWLADKFGVNWQMIFGHRLEG